MIQPSRVVRIATSLFLMFAAIACGGRSSTLATTPSKNPITIPLLNISGQLVFPAINGASGTATYTLASQPSNGAALTLTTQIVSAGLPTPLGQNASILVAFSIAGNQQIQLAKFPSWEIVPPAASTLTAPYGVEVFDGSLYVQSYAATVANGTISAAAIGCGDCGIVPGHTYIFEIVQNPALAQFPH